MPRKNSRLNLFLSRFDLVLKHFISAHYLLARLWSQAPTSPASATRPSAHAALVSDKAAFTAAPYPPCAANGEAPSQPGYSEHTEKPLQIKRETAHEIITPKNGSVLDAGFRTIAYSSHQVRLNPLPSTTFLRPTPFHASRFSPSRPNTSAHATMRFTLAASVRKLWRVALRAHSRTV
ncbi:hypothetical protein C8Q79DRAFT_333208 [Trametes meyenii]|nr:hypothetical protein C8Q79DRAFT_333208 [Trametes meyenii]